MGEVLSQSEIDNLLAALSSGELDVDQMQDPSDKQVKDYDFKRPAKFSKEHLRTLEIIYEHYGRLRMFRFRLPVRKPLPFRNLPMRSPIRLFWVLWTLIHLTEMPSLSFPPIWDLR